MLRTFKNIHHYIYTSLYPSFDFIPPCICSHLVSPPSLYLFPPCIYSLLVSSSSQNLLPLYICSLPVSTPPPLVYTLSPCIYSVLVPLQILSPLYLPLVSTPSCSLLPSKLMIYIPWTAQHLDTTRDKNIFSCVLLASPPFFYSFSSVLLASPSSF